MPQQPVSRPVVGLAAVLLAAACASSTTSPPTAGTPSNSPSSSPAASPAGTVAQAWAARHGGTGGGHVLGQSVAVGPDGATTFVTGSAGTLAYRTATGAQVWVAPSTAFAGSGGSTPPPTLAVSPDGSTVFVAGSSTGGGGRRAPGDVLVLAYDSRTGRQLWTASYDGPAHGDDGASAVAATASAVVVTGTSSGSGTGADLVTLAYDPRSGARRWVARYDGPRHADEVRFPAGPRSLALSRDGATAVVTAGSPGAGGLDAVTVAYDTASGKQRWVSRYRPPSGDAMTLAVAVAGGTAYAVGTRTGSGGNADVLVLAYDLATGTQRWTSAYDGPSSHNDGAVAVAADPAGTRLVVAGTSEGATVPGSEDWVVLGLDPATGAQRWVQRYDGPRHGDDNVAAMVLSPDGTTAYVTGWSEAAGGGHDWATVAFAAATGDRRWEQRYAAPGAGQQADPRDVATSPDGRTVVVTGDSGGCATVAYRG